MTLQIAVIKATLKYSTQEDLIRGMRPLISTRGLFIHTRTTRPVGSEVRFEFTLADGSQTYSGEGIVRKEVPFVGGASAQTSGMLVALKHVNGPFKAVIDAILGDESFDFFDAEVPIPTQRETTGMSFAQPFGATGASDADVTPIPKTREEILQQHVAETRAAEPVDNADAPKSNESPVPSEQQESRKQIVEGAHSLDFFGDLDPDAGLDFLFSDITDKHQANNHHSPMGNAQSGLFGGGDKINDNGAATVTDMPNLSNQLLGERIDSEHTQKKMHAITGQYEPASALLHAEREADAYENRVAPQPYQAVSQSNAIENNDAYPSDAYTYEDLGITDDNSLASDPDDPWEDTLPPNPENRNDTVTSLFDGGNSESPIDALTDNAFDEQNNGEFYQDEQDAHFDEQNNGAFYQDEQDAHFDEQNNGAFYQDEQDAHFDEQNNGAFYQDEQDAHFDEQNNGAFYQDEQDAHFDEQNNGAFYQDEQDAHFDEQNNGAFYQDEQDAHFDEQNNGAFYQDEQNGNDITENAPTDEMADQVVSQTTFESSQSDANNAIESNDAIAETHAFSIPAAPTSMPSSIPPINRIPAIPGIPARPMTSSGIPAFNANATSSAKKPLSLGDVLKRATPQKEFTTPPVTPKNDT